MDALSHDVTGGMRAKLASAASMATLGVVVFIVEAGTPHAQSALRGVPPLVGTVVCLDGQLSSQSAL
eukprot:gene8297-10634_t